MKTKQSIELSLKSKGVLAFLKKNKKIKNVKKISKKLLTDQNLCGIILPLRKNAPLAQLVEQLTLNQWVPGSNP